MTYLRAKIDDDAMKHLMSRFKPNSIKPFETVDEIYSALEEIFDDPNRRINALKKYRRLKQVEPFKEFSAFWSEFQRLANDIEISDRLILLKDLKDKMS